MSYIKPSKKTCNGCKNFVEGNGWCDVYCDAPPIYYAYAVTAAESLAERMPGREKLRKGRKNVER
jgi:hypothetical protein